MGNLISVVIPCHNAFKYSEKCLSALENQTVLPDEVVIGDDCSTDDSFLRFSEYQKQSKLNVKLFKNDKNEGPGATRKNALSYVSGDYIVFCDCDDWYETDFIADIKQIIEEEKADLIIFDNNTVCGDSVKKANVTSRFLKSDKRRILAYYPMSLCRFAVKTEICKSVDFPSLYHGEDGAVASQIICSANKISVTDKAYYNYLIRNDSASFKTSPTVCENLFEAFLCIEKSVDKSFKAEKEFIGVKTVCYGGTLNAFKAGIEKKKIVAYLNEFEKIYPDWYGNSYIKSLGFVKRFYLFCVYRGLYCFCRFMAKNHDSVLLKRK